MLYVQFSDDTKTAICSVFSSHQDESIFPNQGTVELSDTRYKAFFESISLQMQSILPTPTN